MSVSLAKIDCATCASAAATYGVPPSAVHSADVEISEVGLTNAWSAVEEVALSLADYREALQIYTDRPTVNSRALVAMAGAQLRVSVSEVPVI